MMALHTGDAYWMLHEHYCDEGYADCVFDVALPEGHAVTFSGGMAKDGLQPSADL